MPVSAATASSVRELLRKRTAISLDATKDYLIENRLSPVANQHGCTGIDELVARATAGEYKLRVAIVEALATHETCASTYYRVRR